MVDGDRIRTLQHSMATLQITEAEILINIPDLTFEELMKQARDAYDPYPSEESIKLYETDLFKKRQRDFIETFLREAIKNEDARPLAIKLGIEWGFWKDEN